MSAPRAARGGSTTNGRSTPPPRSRERATARGSTPQQLRGGRGRGSATLGLTNARAEGLLQGLQSGSLNKKPPTTHGHPQSGRGKKTQFVPLCRITLEKCAASPHFHAQPKQPTSLPVRSGNLPIKGRASTPRGPSRSGRGRGTLSSASTTPSARPSSQAGGIAPAQSDHNARYAIVCFASYLVY